MIAKITTGGGARGALGYVLGNKRGQELQPEGERERGQEGTPERAAEQGAELAVEPTEERERSRAQGKEQNAAREQERGRHEGSDDDRERGHGRGGSRDLEDAPAYRDGERARIIGGNMSGRNERELAREFGDFRALRPEVKNAVHHASISAAKGERLTVKQWREIADEYVRGQGYERSCYVVVQHRDEPQQHVHIIASNITVDGKVVEQYQNYGRAEAIMREVERKHELERVPMSHEVERRAMTRGEMEEFARTGEPSTKMRLQDTVDRALRENPSAREFVGRMERAGVHVNPHVQSTGRVSGISFERDGEVMKGSNLGRGYSWQGLQRRGLEYDEGRDLASLKEAKVRYLEAQLGRQEGQEVGREQAGETRRQLEEARASLSAERTPEQERGHGQEQERAAAPARSVEEPQRAVTAEAGPPPPAHHREAELSRASGARSHELPGGEGAGREALRQLDGAPGGRDALARAAGYDLSPSAEERLREAVQPAHERAARVEREEAARQAALEHGPGDRDVAEREHEHAAQAGKRRGAAQTRETPEVERGRTQELERTGGRDVGYDLSR